MADAPETGARFAAELPQRPDAVQLRARRSPRLIALGVLCAALGGLIAAFLYTSASTSNTVLVLTHTVERGQVLTDADLSQVTVGSLAGVSSVPAERVGEVVGKTALVDLQGGSLLVAESVGEPSAPAGTTQVGLKLSAGRVPTLPLPAGANVSLIEIVADSSEPGKVVKATILAPPRPLGDGLTLLVDVRVPVDDADRVGVLSAIDRLVLVRQADS